MVKMSVGSQRYFVGLIISARVTTDGEFELTASPTLCAPGGCQRASGQKIAGSSIRVIPLPNQTLLMKRPVSCPSPKFGVELFHPDGPLSVLAKRVLKSTEEMCLVVTRNNSIVLATTTFEGAILACHAASGGVLIHTVRFLRLTAAYYDVLRDHNAGRPIMSCPSFR